MNGNNNKDEKDDLRVKARLKEKYKLHVPWLESQWHADHCEKD